MNPYTLVALIVLALFATGAYFYGTKKNRWIASRLTKELEGLLKPRSTNYVNIGGNIGYNFVYALNEPFASAKGTITLSPRHSVLYLPFSPPPRRTGPVLHQPVHQAEDPRRSAFGSRRAPQKAKIAGMDAMERGMSSETASFSYSSGRDADLSAELGKMLEALPDTSGFKHFCAYPETKTFFFHGNPRGASLGGNLDAMVKRVSLFTGKEKP
jgi:hypothetical protein